LKVPPPDAQSVALAVPEGTTLTAAAGRLEEAGLIRSAFWYRVYARLDGKAEQIKAGEYTLKEGMSFSALARALSRGPVRDEVKITVIEGWTTSDIRDALAELGVDIRDSDFYAERFAEEFPFLAGLPRNATLEGFLFPDTYRVWKDELPDGLFRKQLSEFELKTAELRKESDAAGKDFYEALTLASIVEKEARFDADRPVIAGIFWNRLDVGMRLQSDATLNYVTRSGRTRLSAADLENASPYNTYQHAGLPPTPIGNPGLPSIQAAVRPEETPYFFFLTDDTGKVYYARNLEEHSANRYRVFGE
jgi:UPF0755 protein